EPRYALAELQELSEWAVANREAGNVLEEPLEAVMKRLKPSALANSGSPDAYGFAKPTILAEPSDNIGGGAPGDGTNLLRALIAAEIENAAVALDDPQAVGALAPCRPGERRTLNLGGRGSRLGGAPLRLEVEFVSRSDGRFALEDANSHLA